MSSRTLVAGSTYRFKLAATKDGAAWDLSSATVTLYLQKPDGTLVTKTGTVYDGPNGLARFDSEAADLDPADVGVWSRSWEITDGAVVQESQSIVFLVEDSP
jgi:hypothetical protein